MKKLYPFYLAIIALVITVLACNFSLAGPKPAPIPVSTEAVQSLQEEVSNAAQQIATTGSATIEITESQLTSALALSLQQLPVLTSPQIHLQNGEIQFTGSASQAGLLGDVNVILKVEAGQDCKLRLQVVTTKLGPLPISEDMISGFLPLAEEAISSMATSGGKQICIDSIVINEGKMVITGHSQ
ncbi:MAG: LmeA family phospholipid-binding protein [Anaerolineales bacterium]|nr:LmeA family phospholipid-binding protein [Anaerolineales bacterium]